VVHFCGKSLGHSAVQLLQDLERQNQVLVRDLAHARAGAGQLAKQYAEPEETITSLRPAAKGL
jgi:hypothetical protein